jgi:hypothetical protein
MNKLKLLFEEYRKALRDFDVRPFHFVSVKNSLISWAGSSSRHFLGLYQVQAILLLLSQWRVFWSFFMTLIALTLWNFVRSLRTFPTLHRLWSSV